MSATRSKFDMSIIHHTKYVRAEFQRVLFLEALRVIFPNQ